MKKVILCGLGAVGLTFAVKFKTGSDFRVLVDSERFERYTKIKPMLNGAKQDFDYILPNNKFEADLIIISTKFQGLNDAIKNISNFVTPKTKIISLLNGISSEEIISQKYPQAKVLRSYFIGHSAVREGNNITQDGIGEIVMEQDEEVFEIFEKCGVNYSVPDDIMYSLWLKFVMNIFSNQTSAVLNMTFGEMKNSELFKDFAKKLIAEVRPIAERKGVENTQNLETDALSALSRMCDEGKTSMLQDILAGRKTEVDMFAGEIIRLGKEFGIPTPYNQVLYDLIKIKEGV